MAFRLFILVLSSSCLSSDSCFCIPFHSIPLNSIPLKKHTFNMSCLYVFNKWNFVYIVNSGCYSCRGWQHAHDTVSLLYLRLTFSLSFSCSPTHIVLSFYWYACSARHVVFLFALCVRVRWKWCFLLFDHFCNR